MIVNLLTTLAILVLIGKFFGWLMKFDRPDGRYGTAFIMAVAGLALAALGYAFIKGLITLISS